MARTGRVHRFWHIGLWLLVAALLLGMTPNTAHYFNQWRALRAESAQLEQQQAQLRQQEQALERELQRVQTDLGRESLARQRGWLRRGEEPLRLNRN